MARESLTIETEFVGEITIKLFSSGSVWFEAPCGLSANGDRIEVQQYDFDDDHATLWLWTDEGSVASDIDVRSHVGRRVAVWQSQHTDEVVDE